MINENLIIDITVGQLIGSYGTIIFFSHLFIVWFQTISFLTKNRQNDEKPLLWRKY